MVNETLHREGPASADAESMKSLRSALRVLMAFCEEQQDFGVGELAEQCKLSKSQVSKVLATFAEFGLLTQNTESRRYQVGARLYALGSRYLNFDTLCRGAMPVMRDLVESTGHSARLSVLDGDRVLYLLGIEGPLFMGCRCMRPPRAGFCSPPWGQNGPSACGQRSCRSSPTAASPTWTKLTGASSRLDSRAMRYSAARPRPAWA